MALFKSDEQRKVERDIKVRQGIRNIERAIREQEKLVEQFIEQAKKARSVGDDQQYTFIRSALKRSATMKRMCERQLLAIQNAQLLKKQAEASTTFASGMKTLAYDIGKLFNEADLTKTQIEWERAMKQSQTMQERMDLFLDAVQDTASEDAEATATMAITDSEIDRLIDAESAASQAQELDDLASLRAEIEQLKKADRTT